MNKYKQDFLESLLGKSFFNAVLHNEVKIYLMEQSDKDISDLETSMDCFAQEEVVKIREKKPQTKQLGHQN